MSSLLDVTVWDDPAIVKLRTEIRRGEYADLENWDRGGCHLVTEALEAVGVGRRVGGYLIWPEPQPDGRRRAIDHFWLVLEDGSILDPTSDSFGLPELGNVARIPAGDPRQELYQPYAMHEPAWHKQFAQPFLDDDIAVKGYCDDCES
jgi:hypothetical protein